MTGADRRHHDMTFARYTKARRESDPKVTRALRTPALVLTAMFLVVIGLGLGRFALTPQPLDVLQLPEQQVGNRVAGFTGPTLRLGDDVTVRATKCVTGGHTVTVRGVVTWQSTDPAGTVMQVGAGSAVRQPGCKTATYENPIPAPVLARTKELLDKGAQFVGWRIIGVEAPVTDRPAVTRTWQTEIFRIVP